MAQENYWKRRQSRRTFLGGAAVAGIGTAALIAGCGDDSSGSSTPGITPAAGTTSAASSTTAAATSAANAPKPGGELSAALTLAPSTLDPHLGNSGGDDYYWRAMFDTLVGVDQDYKIQEASSLAESWEQPDDTTIIFHLRDGVTLHDGSTFDSDLVKWNMDRVKDPELHSTYAALMAPLEQVETPDPKTATFHMDAPDAAMFSNLYQRGGAIISRQAADQFGDQFGSHPVGAGPFIFDEYVPNSHVRMKKNPNYWRKDAAGNALPYLDAVTLRILPDQTSALASMKSGQLQLMGINPSQLSGVENDKSFTLLKVPGSSIGSLLVFNLDKPEVSDVRVRQAIAMSINAEAVNKAVYFDTATVADSGLWPEGSWIYQPSSKYPKYDLDKAKQLLSEAGVSSPNIGLLTYSATTLVQQSTLYQSQLKQAGINAQLSQLAVGPATADFFVNHTVPVFSTSWSFYPEPDNASANNFDANGYYNPMKKFIDPKMEALLKQGRETYDQDERKKIYNEVNDIVLEQCYYVPYIYGTALLLGSSKLQNMDKLVDGAKKWVYPELWIKS